MKIQEFTDKLKKELPELNWKDYVVSEDIISDFAFSEILVGDFYGSIGLRISSSHVAKKVLNYIERNNLDTTGRFKQVFDSEEGFISINDIDDYILDLIIKGLKNWKEYIDRIRKSKDERDQLIIIHPDWDIDSFKNDFKIVCGDNRDYRIGIMSTKDWDFSNDKLCSELTENSCDCFGIGLLSDVTDSFDEFLEDSDDELTKAWEELKEKYPDFVVSYEDIYITDFD